MAVKLFVGNLPYKTTSEDLGQLFSQAGTVVSAEVVMDRMSGRSRGFGFVEMEDADSQAAVEKLNGYDIEGRKLVVNVARPREDRPQGGGFDRRGGDSR
ncbi:MAG: RNA-binding protein [Patescibacteria group bacterium]